MKICRICKDEKELEEFHKHPSTTDKRFSMCKECNNEVSRTRYQKVKEDPEKYALEREKYNANKRKKTAALKKLYGKK